MCPSNDLNARVAVVSTQCSGRWAFIQTLPAAHSRAESSWQLGEAELCPHPLEGSRLRFALRHCTRTFPGGTRPHQIKALQCFGHDGVVDVLHRSQEDATRAFVRRLGEPHAFEDEARGVRTWQLCAGAPAGQAGFASLVKLTPRCRASFSPPTPRCLSTPAKKGFRPFARSSMGQGVTSME